MNLNQGTTCLSSKVSGLNICLLVSDLEGGPVAHKYALQQFHLHWGKTANSGSEHRVEGKMYASEVSDPEI